MNEIDMMKKVAKGNNTHVVGLIGCVTVEEPLCLVIEYLEYGDLQSYLHSIKKEVKITFSGLFSHQRFFFLIQLTLRQHSAKKFLGDQVGSYSVC